MKTVHMPTKKLSKMVSISSTEFTVFNILTAVENYGDSTGSVDILALPGVRNHVVKAENEHFIVISQSDGNESICVWFLNKKTNSDVNLLIRRSDNTVYCRGDLNSADKTLLETLGKILGIDFS